MSEQQTQDKSLELQKEIENLREDQAKLKDYIHNVKPFVDALRNYGVESVQDLNNALSNKNPKPKKEPKKSSEESGDTALQSRLDKLEKQQFQNTVENKLLRMKGEIQDYVSKNPDKTEFFRKNPESLRNALAIYERLLLDGNDVSVDALVDNEEQASYNEYKKWNGEKEEPKKDDKLPEEVETAEEEEVEEEEVEEEPKKDDGYKGSENMRQVLGGYDPLSDPSLPGNRGRNRKTLVDQVAGNLSFNNEEKSTKEYKQPKKLKRPPLPKVKGFVQENIEKARGEVKENVENLKKI